MPIVETHKLTPATRQTSQESLWTYCALDCCLTLEVFQEISKNPRAEGNVIYSFERALQAPALEIMLRGFKVDLVERQRGIAQLREQKASLEAMLNEFARAVWDKDLNPRSQKQLQDFFYNVMKLPKQWISSKGERKLSMGREALEKLELYFHAKPIIGTILSIRDVAKQVETLAEEIRPNGRFYTSINIAGTNTGRFSSSKSSEGDGGNIQNKKRDDDLEPGEVSVRKMFIADEGFVLCEIDLEQAESFEVGWIQGTLFNDWRYLDACEAGDLHTTTAKLVWPDLGWTGDKKADRAVADQSFYRHFSYRDMSKRGGHLTNYYGTAYTAARSLKTPQKLMENFQAKYALGREAAYPCFPRWWQWVAQQIQTKFKLVNVFGRERHFFGRPNDDTTLRKAIAYGPQSATAERTNLGLLRIWREMKEVQLLAQKHDSVTFQFREDLDWAKVVSKAQELMNIPIRFDNYPLALYANDPLYQKLSREYCVSSEAKIGYNWGNYHPVANPNGLTKWKGSDLRKRIPEMPTFTAEDFILMGK